VSGSAGRLLAYGVALAGLLALPLALGDYPLHVLVEILLVAYLGGAWNLAGGYAGLFSFGHAAFYGLGAYTSTVLLLGIGLTPWIGLLAAGAMGALLGTGIGALCFRYRLRGPFLALATLAVAEMLRVAAINTRTVGGAMGLLIPLRGSAPAFFQFRDKRAYYYVALLLVVGMVFLTRALERSRWGYRFQAVRDDDEAAACLGVDVFRTKCLAMALSGGLTAVGGVFYAQYFFFIDPPTLFGSGASVDILLPAIVGGAGTVAGPLVGAALLGPLAEITRGYLRGYVGVHLIAYGLILLGVILYLPQGLVPAATGWWRRRRAGQAARLASGSGRAA
jgi:branched-chain amino acid transport system permease protein